MHFVVYVFLVISLYSLFLVKKKCIFMILNVSFIFLKQPNHVETNLLQPAPPLSLAEYKAFFSGLIPHCFDAATSNPAPVARRAWTGKLSMATRNSFSPGEESRGKGWNGMSTCDLNICQLCQNWQNDTSSILQN